MSTTAVDARLCQTLFYELFIFYSDHPLCVSAKLSRRARHISRKMYGMVLQSMVAYLQENYGDEMYRAILEAAGIPVTVFNTHEVYPDRYVKALGETAALLLGEHQDASYYIECFGRKFVKVKCVDNRGNDAWLVDRK